MFTKDIRRNVGRPKNLENIPFAEKSIIESTIDQLLAASHDPYTASVPLIASAEMGDRKRYEIARDNMENLLENMDQPRESKASWRDNNSFKAWMWGRVLLAADSVNDANMVVKAKTKLQSLLEHNTTTSDNLAFLTWAWCYRGCYDKKEYDISKSRMLNDTSKLTDISNVKKEHSALSDAMWALVMRLQAAAYAGDQNVYEGTKEQMKLLTQTDSVSKALEKGLLRTTESNDYPAWAMGKVRCAAIIIKDKKLYVEIEGGLNSSINEAFKANSEAEYILSILDNRLAIYIAEDMHAEKKVGLSY